LAPSAAGAQAPAAAQPAPTNQQPVVVIGQKPAKPKRICQSYVPTGSIRRQTFCMTEAESKDVETRSAAELERLKDAQFRLQQMRIARQMMGDGPPH
jgi:hypothetical protein